ncbi:MAG: DUF192 domain-containing protein [Planctomycetota bacterium]|nr:DUF192 domain-containing protein [Planctomycetota bacterium]
MAALSAFLTWRIWSGVFLVSALAAMSLGTASCKKPAIGESTARVTIKGRTYTLDLALDPKTREKGLGGRDSIPETGGMLFVFPRAERLSFLMRDCPVPIDVIFLDSAGRVTATHAMLPEAPRGEDEKELNIFGINEKYELRLKKYPSRSPAQFAIELRGGELEKLQVKVGDKIDLDLAALKARAK